MRIIYEVTHCHKRVTQSFRGCDPLVGIQAEHTLQQVDKLSSISFLSQHVSSLQMRRQVDLETHKTHSNRSTKHGVVVQYRECAKLFVVVCN